MTDFDDKLRRRYREIATEEPSAVIDAAILARARAARPGRSRWIGPVSIAAVLVLGIGVSLRMQLEQPGIETSVPAGEPAVAASEYSLPPGAGPEPAPKTAIDAAVPPPQKPAAQARRDAAPAFVPAPPVPKLQAPAASRAEPAPPIAPLSAESPQAGSLAATPRPAATPPPAASPPRAAARIEEAPAAAQSAPLRAKREAASDSLGASGLRKELFVETDPARELERIAKLREDGNHVEADKAITEFRRRHPDYRIPDALWERMKPR